MVRHRARLGALALSATLSAGPALAVTTQEVHAAAARPDIVVFMVDDLGYIQTSPVLKRLPNINRIFRNKGMRLQRIYNQTPMCGPSRANIYTGQNTLHHGVSNNNGGRLDYQKTVFKALRSSGHHVVVAGKLINNVDKSKIKGIDERALMWDQGKSSELRKKSLRLVRNAPDDKPLFALISTTAPHAKSGSFKPVVEPAYRGAPQCQGIGKFKPPTYYTKTSGKYPFNMPDWPAGWPLKPICESLLPFDETVGAVVAAQAERGREAWLFFLSDNGVAYGQFGYPTKANPYSTRGVFYVNGPGVARGARRDELLSFTDIAPTLAKIGNASMPWADGRSFLPLLKGQKYYKRVKVLEHFPHPDPKTRYSANRKVYWNLIRYGTGRTRLTKPSYQLFETTSYHKKKPGLAKSMSDELTKMIKESRY